MCLILLSHRTHPDYPLVLASNRDEYYARPSKDLHRWPETPHILAGKDLQEGGTWLGISDQGRFAALTNVRETPSQTATKSRGHLVADFLRDKAPAETFLRELIRHHALFKGFNLLVGDNESLFYFSNRDPRIQTLAPGYYGLSNHLLNSPWPKLTQGLSAFKTMVEGDLSEEGLLTLLAHDQAASDDALPDTGIGLANERLLSPIFIKSTVYGTRTSSVIIRSRSGSVAFTEQHFGPEGEVLGRNQVQVQIQALN